MANPMVMLPGSYPRSSRLMPADMCGNRNAAGRAGVHSAFRSYNPAAVP